MSEKVKLVLPDTGPLITLAQAEALDALLVFDADHFQLVVTDMLTWWCSRPLDSAVPMQMRNASQTS